ncbi:zinc finger protein 665-like [Schistocerca piceifrons]|uniref:zinc finger protein 665-like n=1 Tax=Schistocerca piceifrons TaxID=274613 RepID=UPI001F5F0AD4|nr:zinc finger protein 665-like [Schistocerca piceifrons]
MMDDDTRSQELLDSVDISQLRPDGKLNTSVAPPSLKVDEDGCAVIAPPVTQYVNIHRLAEPSLGAVGGKGGTGGGVPSDCGPTGLDLVPHHVVHNGLVVDMMVPGSAGEFVAHGAAGYLPPVGDHYDEDVLLTEDDRRLAAALVAVQIAQQQKHHGNVGSSHHGLPHPQELGLVTVNGALPCLTKVPDHHNGSSVPMSPDRAAVVQGYIQTAGVVVDDDQEHQLLTEQGDRILKLYHQAEQAAASAPSTTTVQTRRHHVQAIQHELPRSPRDELKEEYDIKSEEDESGDEQALDQEADIDAGSGSSDYGTGRASRRSLPHKKRIPRKLKQQQQQHQHQQQVQHQQSQKSSSSPSRSLSARHYKCNRCGAQFNSQSSLASHRQMAHHSQAFSCELCGRVFTHQIKFFEHLKSHYEPLSATSTVMDEEATDHVDEPDVPQEQDESQVKLEPLRPVAPNSSSTAVPVSLPQSPPTPVYSCPHCGKTFRRQKVLETHISQTHPKQEEIEFSDPEDLMEGIRDVVNVTAAADDADPSNVVKGGPSWYHHVGSGDWYREDELTAAEADLHEIEDSLACELCGDVFTSKELVAEHVRRDHLDMPPPPPPDAHSDPDGEAEADGEDPDNPPAPDPGPANETSAPASNSTTGGKRRPKRSRRELQLTCPECFRRFNHRNSLVYHLRSHSGERPHQCEVCGKSFFAASALKVHMRLHSGDKPYKCEYCGRHFRQWGDLKYHCISIHSEEKNYQCEYCGKDFARKYSLIVHRRIHTGEKNYKCEFCGKSFRASSYLQNHRRIHTGEKPHPCNVCGKPFRVRSDMKRHLNTHNRERHRSNGARIAASSATEDQLKVEEAEVVSGLSHTVSVEHQTATQQSLSTVAEISVQDAAPPDSLLPEETGGSGLRHSALGAAAEEVLYHTRDTLDAVRDSSTLYVWPIYMS